ncbi:MAG: EAL domain-containing protein [Pseudanabaenaceae cyanobacterium bins.39]|nr:EAL domain-containing protein [Pseudanabaenaceae cyanobacterium bins.39]
MIFSGKEDKSVGIEDIELEVPVILSHDTLLKEAILIISGKEGNKQSCILVEDQGAIVGILTERDLVRLCLVSTTLQNTKVSEVMTHPVKMLEQENFTDIFSAYSLMRRYQIRHLPIVKQQKVVGIVTISILRQNLHVGYFLRFREVQEIMTHHVITIEPHASVMEVAQLMAKHRISCVVVVNNNTSDITPVGILTERDIVQFQAMELNLQNLLVGAVMSSPLLYLRPEDSLEKAQKMMQQYRVRRVVVINQSGQLCGIVTETNLSQTLDPIELFGIMEILQRRIQSLVRDRNRLLPQENRSLHKALQNHEFQLYYHPQINTQTGKLVGAEALVRWHSPQRGIVAPSEFIPIAEMTGFIIPLGQWILRRACEQVIAWQKQGFPPFVISVNVSSLQLQDPQFVTMLKLLLMELNFDSRWLKLELTESTLVENIEHTLSQFQAIKQLGVAIAIDDFGTGYASLGYLQHFPFDTLKIDRCFVENIHQNPKNAAIATAIIRMAHQLNFSVVAEGIEQEEELQFLKELHCYVVQGYLISRPLPVEDFQIILQKYM